MEDHLPRKLAVILHADVVGSTLLVQQNETLAHERIQSTFHRFSETIKSYEGIAHELRGTRSSPNLKEHQMPLRLRSRAR